MRAYVVATLISFIVAILFGAGWYILFGYNFDKTIIDNLYKIFVNISYWKGVGIWTVLYALMFAYPIVFLRKAKRDNNG